jgi:PucR C-terminal helix-turn-helix domain
VATVSEVLRNVSPDFVVLAGAAGLGRDVRRILLVRPSSELTASIGRGDLVVYALAGTHVDSGEAADRAVAALLSEGVAGVLSDLVPTQTAIQAADTRGSPLLATSLRIDPEQLYAMLVRALEHQQTALGVLQTELQVDFARLSRAGGSPAMLLERLVEATGQTGILQSKGTDVEALRQPVLQGLEPAVVRRAIHASDAAAQRWTLETADATVANVLYLELPADRLVRLVAPVWIDGQVRAAVSVLARSDELSGRDRVALVAAARAIATAYAEVPPQIGAGTLGKPYGAVVLRAHGASLEQLAQAASLRFEPFRGEVTVGREDVRACLPYASQARWRSHIAEWHAQLSADLGPVSMGHAVRNVPEPSDAQSALVQAAEATLLGDDLFGPGHVTSYADAQLARFLLDNRQASELRALYERVVGKLAAEDLKRESELVTTLEAYCETFATQGTAERLGIHRNTVLYRLKLIEEITSVDLDDGSSRFLLQLGLLAGRLARQSSQRRPHANAACGGPHLVKVGRRAKASHARTA